MDTHRNPVLRTNDDVPNIRGVTDQPKAANIIELSTLRIKSASGIGVVDRKLLYHGRYCDVVPVKSRRVEKHLILHHGAAKAGIVRDPGHLLILALDDPVFEDLQFLRRAVRTLKDIPVHQPRRTRQWRKRGRNAGRISYLAQSLENHIARKIIVGPILER